MSNSVHSTSAAGAENPIIAALDRPKYAVDDKGAISLSEWGVNDQRLAMSFKLVRGLDRVKLIEFVNNIVSEAKKRADPTQELQGYVDMFVMAFHTRDIQEGKGERDLFYWFIMALYKLYPKTVLALLPAIPLKFGSYKDFNKLYEMCMGDFGYSGLSDEIVRLYADQLRKDDAALTKIKAGDKSQSMSLVGKWTPNEGGHFDKLAKAIALKLFESEPVLNDDGTVKFKSYTDVKDAIMANGQIPMRRRQATLCTDKTLENARISCLKRYRKLYSRLRKHLDVVEIKMCDREGHWSDIRPGAVPARCLSKNSKAFRNLNKDKTERSVKADRRQCAENFANHLQKAIENPAEARVHGKNMMPHELVRKYMPSGYYGCSSTEIDPVVEAQWIDLRERLKETGALDYFIAMADVSGSMSGTPMEVSVALSILVSEVATPAFRDRFLTFSAAPTWHNLSGLTTLKAKVASTMSANWGMNTDFGAALQTILDACVTNNVPAEEVAKITLAVFSDMQFDTACGIGSNAYCGYGGYGRQRYTAPEPFKTKHQKIADKFKAAGYVDADGKGIVPTIIFWNLQGATVDFPADADTPGVAMVSGFSANGLKAFMDGSLLEMTAEKPPTPYEIFRKGLDNERYDSVRETCEAVGEIKAQNGQVYLAPVREVEVDDLVEVRVDEGAPAPPANADLDDAVSSVDDFVPIDMGDAASVAASEASVNPLDDKIAKAKELLAQLEALKDA